MVESKKQQASKQKQKQQNIDNDVVDDNKHVNHKTDTLYDQHQQQINDNSDVDNNSDCM